MSDLLAIGASGLRAYQSALTTTSNNIANVDTPGYVRRTTALADVTANGTSRSSGGMGVIVTGIEREADSFRAAEVRAAGAELARTESGITWLDRIDGALADTQIAERMAGFFNAATALAADPSAPAPRAVMLEQAGAVAGAFTASARALGAAAAETDAVAADSARSLSDLSGNLARINVALGRATPGTSGQAQLLDQRDMLLENMSALVDTKVDLDPAGRATVRAGGPGGPVLVTGDSAATITAGRDDAGALTFTSMRAGVEATLVPGGGAMAGVIDGAGRIADARAALQEIAGDFTDRVNTVQAAGDDLSGKPGDAMFALAGDGTMSVALADGAAIAAARRGAGTRDNGNLSSLAQTRADGGFEKRTVGLVAANGAAIASRRTVADAQGAIREGAVAARDAASGINLDEEAVDLMRFQQAYQASSRVIQVARETLQTLFDIR